MTLQQDDIRKRQPKLILLNLVGKLYAFMLVAAVSLPLPVTGSFGETKDESSWRIVPGKSIGKIYIGMEQADMMQTLGAPHVQEDLTESKRNGLVFTSPEHVRPLPKLKGVQRDDWITPRPLPKAAGDILFMCDFLCVYVRDRRVVQIEISSRRFQTADGLSTANSAEDFQKHYPHFASKYCRYHHPSAGGIPGLKRFLYYEDASAEGIAWSYGAIGDLAPDPDPSGSLDTIIVHMPGKPVMPDPDGLCRFVWKDEPDAHSWDK